MIEFSKQAGQEELAKLAAPNVMRLHTIPRPELDQMQLEGAVERYVRAATERSIPLLYLRPLLTEEGIFWLRMWLCGKAYSQTHLFRL